MVDAYKKQNNPKSLGTAILSLSLLTVMAGAAVAPALGTLKEHFSSSGDTVVQMIISMPALFIFLSSFIFPALCRKFRSKTLVLIGLALYVLGGCGAALFDNIWIVLCFRAVVGMGVGIIMPLSTGLLSFYYPPEEQDRLMGLSSAMNQMGGAVATFIAGLLAAVSWRAAFLVYLMGLISVVLCIFFLPNDRIGGREEAGESDVPKKDSSAGESADAHRSSDAGESVDKKKEGALKKYGLYVASMFVLMSIFFIYPSNYAIETAADGFLSQQGIATVMALMDVVAFFGGLSFVGIKGRLKSKAHFAAPLLFLAGYILLSVAHGAVISVAGSFLVGFANGAGIPCIIAAASRKAGKDAVSTVMPMISAAMYMGQFLSPFIMSIVKAVFGGIVSTHLPFVFAAVLSVLLLVLANSLRADEAANN